MRRFRVVLLILSALPFIAPVQSQDWRGRGSLRGQVVDSEDNPVGGVEIQARLDAAGETLLSVTANERGRFNVTGVRAGAWVLLVEHPGYEPLQMGVNAAASRSDDPVTAVLKPLPPEALAGVDIEAANQALLQGDYGAARASYGQAMTKLPASDHPPILLGIARTYLNEQDADSAREVLEQILELDPQNVEAARLLASAMSAQGEVEAAQQLLSRFEDVEPDFNTLVGIGVSRYNAGDVEEAREHFDRAINQQPDQAYPYYYRGLCGLADENSDSAVADFQRFLELDPEADERDEVESYLDFLLGDE